MKNEILYQCSTEFFFSKSKLQRNFSMVLDFFLLSWLRSTKAKDMKKVIDTLTKTFTLRIREKVVIFLMGSSFNPKLGTAPYLYKDV